MHVYARMHACIERIQCAIFYEFLPCLHERERDIYRERRERERERGRERERERKGVVEAPPVPELRRREMLDGCSRERWGGESVWVSE